MQLLTSKRFWHVFSCEFCKIYSNTIFIEHVRTTVSDYSDDFVVDFEQLQLQTVTGL